MWGCTFGAEAGAAELKTANCWGDLFFLGLGPLRQWWKGYLGSWRQPVKREEFEQDSGSDAYLVFW